MFHCPSTQSSLRWIADHDGQMGAADSGRRVVPKAFPYSARSIVAVLLAGIVSTANSEVIQSNIDPGEKLVVTFAFDSPPTTAFGIVDYLQFGGGVSFNAPIASITVNLYDGDILLGTKLLGPPPNASCNCIFVVPGSLGTTTQTVDIDTTSIVNGTIDGRIEYVPTFSGTPPVDIPGIQLAWQLQTGRFLGYAYGALSTPQPTITAFDVITIVPVPATLWLLGPALGLLAPWARYKRRPH